MSDELKSCPFCGGDARTRKGAKTGLWFMDCPNCCMDFCAQTEDELIARWNARAERTCRKVPGKMHYGERRPKCSECGYGLGDSRWLFCPQCGAKVVS